MGAGLPSVYYHASREYVGVKNSTKKTAFLTLSSVLTILALATATLGTAHATSATSYSFNLIGPNTAMAHNAIPGTPIAAGDILRLTGSGAFDLSTSSASGGGSFTHYKPDRSVFARGLWVVTGFQSFTSYGGPSQQRFQVCSLYRPVETRCSISTISVALTRTRPTLPLFLLAGTLRNTSDAPCSRQFLIAQRG